MKNAVNLVLPLFVRTSPFAASADTVVIYNPALQKAIKCVIVKPDYYENSNPSFPVVYLLHGYGDY